MSVEEKMKGMLGEQAFHIVVLLHQIDELQKRVAELQQQQPVSRNTSPPDAATQHQDSLKRSVQ